MYFYFILQLLKKSTFTFSTAAFLHHSTHIHIKHPRKMSLTPTTKCVSVFYVYRSQLCPISYQTSVFVAALSTVSLCSQLINILVELVYFHRHCSLNYFWQKLLHDRRYDLCLLLLLCDSIIWFGAWNFDSVTNPHNVTAVWPTSTKPTNQGTAWNDTG